MKKFIEATPESNPIVFSRLKQFESMGYLAEEKNRFSFVSEYFGSVIFFQMDNFPQERLTDPANMPPEEIVIKVLANMSSSNLKQVYNSIREKFPENRYVKEDQWIIEFACALKKILPMDSRISSQAGNEIHEDFVGELDLYIDGNIKLGIEFTREGRQIEEHALRRLRAEYPSLVSSEIAGGQYYLPTDSRFLLLDFTHKENFKVQYGQQPTQKKWLVNKTDLTEKLKDCLMRIVYDSQMESFEVYFREELYQKIVLAD